MAIPDRVEVVERTEPEIAERGGTTLRPHVEVCDPDFYRDCLLCGAPIGWAGAELVSPPNWVPFTEVMHTTWDPFRRETTLSMCVDCVPQVVTMVQALASHLSPERKAS